MVTDTLTLSLTDMPHNDPAQYTVLGWVKRFIIKGILIVGILILFLFLKLFHDIIIHFYCLSVYIDVMI